MQVRKTYREVNPELLYDEVKEFVLKQGLLQEEAKLETYSTPGGSSHVARGTLVFKNEADKAGTQCLRAHIVGSVVSETKVILDIDESLFSAERITAVQDDLDFIFGTHEVKPR